MCLECILLRHFLFGFLAHDLENLMLTFQLPDQIPFWKSDGLHWADRAAGAAANHTTHRINWYSFVILHFIHSTAAGGIAQCAANAGIGIYRRKPGNIFARNPVPHFILCHLKPPYKIPLESV
jgi:hypothetical protein